MSHGASSTTSQGDHAHGQVGHIVPVWLLAVVLFILLILTALTYALAGVKLGNANIVVAIGIATVKAALVAMFFMHLRWDRPFNAVIFVASLLFVALFISLAMIDTTEYQPTLVGGQAPGIVKP